MKDIPVLKVDTFFKQEEIFIFLSLAVNISKLGIDIFDDAFPGKEEELADQVHNENIIP